MAYITLLFHSNLSLRTCKRIKTHHALRAEILFNVQSVQKKKKKKRKEKKHPYLFQHKLSYRNEANINYHGVLSTSV